MKTKRIVLLAFFLICSLIVVPTKAEEVPYTVNVVQLDNGNIKVSSEFPEVISGFNSLLLKKADQEMVYSVADAIKNTGFIVFPDPNLNGDFEYDLNFKIEEEEFSLKGEIYLKKTTKYYSSGNQEDLQGILRPESPLLMVGQDDMAICALAFTETGRNKTAEIEIFYSTSKNGKYKKLTQLESDFEQWYDEEDDILYVEGIYAYCQGENLTVGKTYYIRARCSILVGGVRLYSLWSTREYRAKVGRVKELTLDILNFNYIKLDWKKASGAQCYGIYAYQYPEGFWDILDQMEDEIWDMVDQYLEDNPWDNNLDFFDWDTWYDMWDALEDYYFSNLKRDVKYINKNTDNALLRLDEIDVNERFEVIVFAARKNGSLEGTEAYVETNPKIYQAVKDITVEGNPQGTEVFFTFDTNLDLSSYKLWRRGDESNKLNKTEKTNTKLNKIKREYNNKIPGSLQKISDKIAAHQNGLVGWSGDYGSLDFKLLVANKPDGVYKRVDTKADFSDDHQLKLSYKARAGEKLYYKIVPTWDSVGWEPLAQDVVNADMNFTMNSGKTTKYDEFVLYPAVPQNPSVLSLDYNLVQVAVDQGEGISGYELYNADSNKLIKRQKGNVFKVKAPFEKPINYKIRCFKMLGKKRIYSDFTAIVTVAGELKAPVLTGVKLPNTVGQVKLSWSKVNGVINYEIWQDGVLIKTIAAKTLTHTVKGLASGDYQFIVKAVRGSTKTDSNVVNINIP